MAPEIGRRSKTSEERERLRAELQSRSVMLFATLASIGDAVITTDSDGDITFLNPMAEELIGWPLQDAIGQSVDSVLELAEETTGGRVANPAREALAAVSKVDLPPGTVLVCEDGRRIPVDDSAAPILSADNEVLGAVMVFRDITERKKAEQTIKYRSELDRIAARISTAFITSPVTEVDERIDEALRDIGEFIGADRIYVFLFDPSDSNMICTHEWTGQGIEPFKGTMVPALVAPHWVGSLMDRRHIRVSGLEDIPAESAAEKAIWMERGLKTFVAVPMLREDRVLGFIAVDSVREAKPWPEETINMLYLLGNVFASAMDRRDAQRKLDAARRREVEIGSRIQQTLLLSTPPVASADFQIAALTIPSRGIDGDFYDFLLHPNRSLDIIFGDVMGKGVPAALLSAGAKTEFLRSLSHLLVSSPRGSIPRPEDIVNSVHSVLTPQLMNLDSYVTLSYVRFDPQAKKVTVVDCGNTRLIRCGADGVIEFLSGFNLPLGFTPAEVYTDAEFGYGRGDLFVLYSDGVTEARSPAGEMFGSDRLRDLVAANRGLPPEPMAQAIREAVTSFVGSAVLADDLTCVVLRVTPEYAGGKPESVDELEVSSSLGELGAIRAFLRGFCEHRQDCGLGERELSMLELAVNEVASNIMKHAYHGRTDQRIWIRMQKEPGVVTMRLTHTGDTFRNVGQIPIPTMEGTREGGFGLYIIDRSVDSVDYGQDAEGRQFIELTKHCGE